MTHRPRHVFEYLLLRFFQFFLTHLPYRGALSVGWCAAAFTHYVMGYRVAEACRRMDEVFPGRFTVAERRRMAWRSWRDFAFSVVDLFQLSRIDEAWIQENVIGHEEASRTILEHCGTGRGAVIASAHMGAAEVASVLMQRFGVPIFVITGRQSNSLVDQVLKDIRSGTGIPMLPRGTALLRSVVGRLKDGGVLGFLADLRVAPGGTIVDFLGAEASVAQGMAKFAKQTGVPIFPLVTRRVGWTRHSLEFADPVFPAAGVDKAEDCRRMTQEVFDVYDRAIRETPEQWFWFNKRWILDPP